MNLTFLIGLIAKPTLEGALSMEWQEFEKNCAQGIAKRQRDQLKRLRTLVDMDNVRALCAKEQLNPCGNWSKELIDSDTAEEVSPFFRQLLAKYSQKELLNALPHIWVEFFERDEQEFGEGGFVWEYFRCELAARWSLAQLREEGSDHPLMQEREEIVKSGRLPYLETCLEWAQEHHGDFLMRIQQLYRMNRAEPLELLRSINAWRLTYIEEMLHGELIGNDRLFGSCAQLMICAEWQRMNAKVGLRALEDMRQTDIQMARGEG